MEQKSDKKKILFRIPNLKESLRTGLPNIKEYTSKAGIDVEPTKISKQIFNISLVANIIFSSYLVYFFILKNSQKNAIYFILIPFIIALGLAFFFFLFWTLFCLFLDFRIFVKEKKAPSIFSKHKQTESKISEFERKRKLSDYISKAGIDLHFNSAAVKIFKYAIIFNLAVNGYMLYTYSGIKPGIIFTLFTTSILWTLGLTILVFLFWILFFVWIDLRIYQRTKKIEEVLPDFLHLTSANISAGMPIDRAMWFAVRPKFGVLAKEIEDVAKSTLVGEKLDLALLKFTKKYDSEILQRSINLLLEGLESGGQVGELLNRIAVNIEETRIIRKEMAASVTTYVIFIVFASIVAAPFLFGLSTELVVIMQTIMSKITMDSASQSGGGMSSMFSFSTDAINIADFRIFSMVSLSITAFFSAIIINVIQKGTVKEGLYMIPVFIGISIMIYMLATTIMHSMLGSLF
ncbi:MAG: type II secretion system F family protein [archaeon]